MPERNWFHQWMRENGPGEYTDSIRGDVKPCIFCHFATDNVHDKSLSECLKSPFFKSIRARQPFSYNTLRPCPMSDHPQAMWQIIKKHGAKPTHEGADTMFTALNSEIHEYAERVRQVMDTAWEKEGYENWAPEWMHHCGLTDEQIERRRREFEKNSSDHKTMPDQQAQAVTGYKR